MSHRMSNRLSRTDGQPDLFEHAPEAADPVTPVDPVDPVVDMLAELSRWVESGWLRALDLALARLLVEQCPQADAVLPLAAALLAHNEGRGHTCLPLDELLGPTAHPALPALPAHDPWLAGPVAAQAALAAVLRRLPVSTLAGWRASLLASGAVDDAGTAAPRVQPAPLLLDGARLYLRRHHRDEVEVARALRSRVDTSGAAVEQDVDRPEPAWVRGWLDGLFGAVPTDRIDHQRLACATALRGRLTLITGGPGTGKTYTVARLLALLQADHERRHGRPAAGSDDEPVGSESNGQDRLGHRPLRIALAAPTGKAAARLQQSIRSALEGLRAGLPDALDWQRLVADTDNARTLHKLLGARPGTRQFAHQAQRPLEVDLLVVDEASMVHLEMMAALLRALPARARLVLLGDQDQLASVEAGAVLGDLCADAIDVALDPADAQWLAACTGQAVPMPDQPGRRASILAAQTVQLRHSHRFAGAIGALARAVNAGEVANARACLGWPQQGADPDRVRHDASVAALGGVDPALAVRVALDGRPTISSEHEAASAGYRAMLAVLRQQRPDAKRLAQLDPDGRRHVLEAWASEVLRAFDRSRLLCAVREGDWGVAGLNEAIEAALRRDGLVARQGEWYEGRPVMVTRNDPSLGVYNGDIGIALRQPVLGSSPVRAGGSGHEPEPLRVWFLDGEEVRSVLASRLSAVETAWAMTVHKSQGSEFAHTVLVLPPRLNPVLSRELVYTGITRARQACTLIAPEPSVFDAALQRRTRRASGLRGRLLG
ncbi:exodeoxyribonuclease V subunit alpha [Leptothrix discophora]|uniref:RecBCD enzyme subunit RecD n=1 Tax=Leptothrix discophora TaxID=89 RepID=A0ABT9FZK1_LEPDI|nr:exodeoxyribonuclease V subunit alpha [Leptothrix discophora]MDP4299656.1 exodeoxyribonuclease V subunit alpha [Leptothrix discophora]